MLMTLFQDNYLNLFNWVLTTSAKACIFIVFLLGVKHVLRHRMGARFQYMLWSVLMIGLVLPWVPSSPLSAYNFINPSYIQQFLSPISKGATEPTTNVVDTMQSSPAQTAAVDSNSSKATLDTNTQQTRENKIAPLATFPFIYKLMFWIWLLGILILTTLTALVNRRFCNKIEHNLVTDPRLITVFNQLKVELKVRAEIPLLKTRYVNSPSLLGFIHPRLLLPIGIEQTFSLEQISHILLHELLHFKRKDIMINWLTQVLVIIHWFNPLIWYAFYRMREDQEISCDALAMERINTKQTNDYAYTLLKLVETYSNTPRLMGLASLSGSKSQIKRRITMLKEFRMSSVKWSLIGLSVIALLAVVVFTNVKNLPDYHIPVNQSDIKEIRISMNGTEKTINDKDWSSIIQEFNNSKITRVRNLEVDHSLVVLFAFNDGSGRTLDFAVNGNEIRVSRHIGETKVDYIAENPDIENIVTKLYDNADTSTIDVPQTPDDLTAEQAGYSSHYPKLEILNGITKLNWTRGDANYTSQPGVLIGNTNFGLGIDEAMKLPVSVLKPESWLEFMAEEVAGLDKPTYQVRLVDSNKQLKLYPISQNLILLPKAEGEYLFQLQVNWGNENHVIYYWFQIETQSATAVDYSSAARDFLSQKNLKIAVNSVGAEDVQLPSDFTAIKEGVRVGDLLRRSNELSKLNNLDFSKYMGQRVKMYTAQIETGVSESNYDVVLFLTENKVVGYWIDAGMKDPKQNRPDFNVLVNLLIDRA
ncbi:M56 family metallopeptidase [Desulfosporosinus lacus]|uniref:Signal transducer regulating beta-lactamase production, contains metallopeptidase domain n=1 Tax=Desulfosporosinus lacus DSM 15449 TaxID=1121420 RepID=A0A1M5ZT79_9FIRM|nr:M56 family metallopeptidase [Desulfosporosinus lacus]SHI27133.1 Signal transducer regulating beta-lactamase production, contains metallopeptidase domain [Desulfosporosinus lacus DSM 15449]